ncbi:MAG: hypothetical protein K2X74_20230 [Acetobacteraceae bacterium]|nr:hypothetical protein [Acetobacteraceae bacterium]
MRTNPFNDTWLFFIGQQPDQLALGFWRWLVLLLFLGLMAGSVWALVVNWRRDPEQRSVANLATWFVRVSLGGMWFQGALWKLPLPFSGPFLDWTKNIGEHAAFEAHRALANDLLVPNIALLGPVVFLAELAFAASLILGLGVRLFALLAMGFALQLWLGLYLHPKEWPWIYWFLAVLMGLFAAQGAGRSLGVDAILRRDGGLPPGLARLHRLVS